MGRVLGSKLRLPEPPDGVVSRPRLVRRFDSRARLVLVVAPPGFGKTTLTAQWARTVSAPVAWLSIDLLDESPADFWRHVIEGIRSIVPTIDDEPGAALEEDPRSRLFLTILIAQLERFDGRAVLVLDSFSTLADRTVSDELALLVERTGDRLQIIVTARIDPPLPLARWRTHGWLIDIRERELRLDDGEALAVGATFRDLGLSDDLVLGVNRRADGWPIALHLALVSAHDAPDPASELRSMAASDRALSDFVVAEILDQLPRAERDVVLDLSVVDWFDHDLATDLAGPGASVALDQLRRRRLLIADIGGHPAAMRFHPLFRELLEAELRWRDHERHRELLHRAAAIWQRRGEVATAFRHLVVVGERGADRSSVGEPTAAPSARPPAEQLTAREQSILELLPTHLSYAEIAERLYVSVNTVKSNLKAVYRKLAVATRSEAVGAARRDGLLTLTDRSWLRNADPPARRRSASAAAMVTAGAPPRRRR
jgi:LuxR family maltose regulon positive regulatory protein